MILGVTPELALMRWPEGARLLAVDHNPHMIESVWPAGRIARPARAECREWYELPLDDGSANAVIGDGSYALMSASEARRVSREVRRVLAPDGRFALRCFTRPERAESADAVFADLLAGRIGSFHAFKWRLAMALYPAGDAGIPVRDVYAAWLARELDRDLLAARLGWSRESIDSIDAYRGADTRLMFPTLRETRALLAEEFDVLDCIVPGYELGDRCPSLLLAPRAGGAPA